jgi:hypothetical protein
MLMAEEIQMAEKEDKEKKRRAYQKPRLRTIELLAEEVLAVGCKTLNAPGSIPGLPVACTGVVCAMPGT